MEPTDETLTCKNTMIEWHGRNLCTLLVSHLVCKYHCACGPPPPVSHKRRTRGKGRIHFKMISLRWKLITCRVSLWKLTCCWRNSVHTHTAGSAVEYRVSNPLTVGGPKRLGTRQPQVCFEQIVTRENTLFSRWECRAREPLEDQGLL